MNRYLVVYRAYKGSLLEKKTISADNENQARTKFKKKYPETSEIRSVNLVNKKVEKW